MELLIMKKKKKTLTSCQIHNDEQVNYSSIYSFQVNILSHLFYFVYIFFKSMWYTHTILKCVDDH